MRTVLFVFNADPMCFIHVLLNALDMHGRGHAVSVVLEGKAVTLVPEVAALEHPLHALFAQVHSAGLLDGACRACSKKLGVDGAIEAANVPLIGDMHGHPSMAAYMERGYTVISF
jgi:hypothetical protein